MFKLFTTKENPKEKLDESSLQKNKILEEILKIERQLLNIKTLKNDGLSRITISCEDMKYRNKGLISLSGSVSTFDIHHMLKAEEFEFIMRIISSHVSDIETKSLRDLEKLKQQFKRTCSSTG